MGGGTEAFEDLGRHCEQEDCHQLDFLPFKCDGCLKVFCLEHRTYTGHACPNADHKNRVVAVCQTCSTSVEKEGGSESDADALRRHTELGSCDATKKRKQRCPAAGCRGQLTLSNASTCRTCHPSRMHTPAHRRQPPPPQETSSCLLWRGGAPETARTISRGNLLLQLSYKKLADDNPHIQLMKLWLNISLGLCGSFSCSSSALNE